ncbi:hypothetical protein [Bradyrhizobium sp. Leo121]|uniref:hypothetical protein n=1 Tax=Bradyrhizobium sp. Leo121 TaxID=1571195 RepID=UPI001028BCA2|nr:hypothetical protein [Bradyrhizobium sp. Leo121]RZN30480.1 hypothetical protein CWO90_20300 [Bradyrhizobium sp. Leo121]
MANKRNPQTIGQPKLDPATSPRVEKPGDQLRLQVIAEIERVANLVGQSPGTICAKAMNDKSIHKTLVNRERSMSMESVDRLFAALRNIETQHLQKLNDQLGRTEAAV